MGLEGIVSKRLGSRYRSGLVAGLAKAQEPVGTYREAGVGRGLGQVNPCVPALSTTQNGRPIVCILGN
jgi:hypothetical protein